MNNENTSVGRTIKLGQIGISRASDNKGWAWTVLRLKPYKKHIVHKIAGSELMWFTRISICRVVRRRQGAPYPRDYGVCVSLTSYRTCVTICLRSYLK